jgi:hypothetical protein
MSFRTGASGGEEPALYMISDALQPKMTFVILSERERRRARIEESL